MTPVDEYRENAREMRRRAGEASAPDVREQYRELSVAWEALAADAERYAATPTD